MNEALKELILASARIFVVDFMYYDRKDDEELNGDQIEEAFKSGLVTVQEVLDAIKQEFRDSGYE